MGAYGRVVGTAISSRPLDQYKTACERCGRGLKGKGDRGNKYGQVLCRDCSGDKTWVALAAGEQRFEDLTHIADEDYEDYEDEVA